MNFRGNNFVCLNTIYIAIKSSFSFTQRFFVYCQSSASPTLIQPDEYLYKHVRLYKYSFNIYFV